VELVWADSGFLFRDRLRTEERTHVTLHHFPPARNGLSSSDAPDIPSAECQEVLTNFWDYLDGNCSSELAERIDAHASSCVPCLRFRRFQERFLASLAELRERSPAPRRLRDRVRKALAVERRLRETAEGIVSPTRRSTRE
jgi:mycothiol system anti-sigma-R factor